MADEELNCREASRLISTSLERGLTEKETSELRFHLSDCDDCHHYDVQLRGRRDAARRYGR